MARKGPKALAECLAEKLHAIRRDSPPHRRAAVEGLGLRDGTFWRRLLKPKPLSEPATSWEPAALKRWLFLVEVRRLHPKTLESLEAKVYRRPHGDERHQALLAWQERFCLTEPWITGEASQTLLWWEGWENSTGRVPRRWQFELEMVERWRQRRDDRRAWIEGTFTYQPPTLSWSPHQEGAEDAIERCRDELERAARDFAERVRGYELYPAYRRLRRAEAGSRHHYGWLISKQVEGRTYSEIAGQSHASEEAVGQAVRRLAGELGLTLRDDRRGRPRGRKDSAPRISPTRW